MNRRKFLKFLSLLPFMSFFSREVEYINPTQGATFRYEKDEETLWYLADTEPLCWQKHPGAFKSGPRSISVENLRKSEIDLQKTMDMLQRREIGERYESKVIS